MTNKSHYPALFLMAALSFVAMYILMYAMVDRSSSVYMNINQAYMAGLMSAPMIAIELVLMKSMYPNKKLNALIIVASLVALALFWILIRQQAAVTDKQFLRSMIPHHSGAILMCEKAAIRDAQIKELCSTIVSGQQAEIEQMRARLAELEQQSSGAGQR